MALKKETPIPIRLTKDEKQELTVIAAETGLTVSTLIRLMVETFVRAYHTNDNSVTLPLNWKQLFSLLNNAH